MYFFGIEGENNLRSFERSDLERKYAFWWKVLVANFVFNIIFGRLEFLLMFIRNCFLNLQKSEF